MRYPESDITFCLLWKLISLANHLEPIAYSLISFLLAITPISQANYWKYTMTQWGQEEVNEENVNSLAQKSASEYLANL